MISLSANAIGLLAISVGVFLAFTVLIVREYEKYDEMRQEFGYRVWTTGLMMELIIWTSILSNDV